MIYNELIEVLHTLQGCVTIFVDTAEISRHESPLGGGVTRARSAPPCPSIFFFIFFCVLP
nr:MAG TPA: hypothetical protein [Caudoviricetes sp.]